MFRMKLVSLVLLPALAVASVAGAWLLLRPDEVATTPMPGRPSLGRMVHLAGGAFRMGKQIGAADQRPVHEVTLSPFWIDEHEVTNRQFARFVAQTGYVTTAEQRGWSHRFDRQTEQWVRSEGADWRHPGGPETSLTGRDAHPVVHVSWHDAAAYARWAGKRLPTEAQWEFAARAGRRDADYPWGDEEMVDGRYRANYRQHDKPPGADGFEFAAPVRQFPPNRFGLYDVSGNVWEWCRDRYGEDYYGAGPPRDPAGPGDGEEQILRGGSWLSPENYRPGHQTATRHKQAPEASYEHIGFRCVRPVRTARR